LTADGGVYSYSGDNANLLYSRLLTADGGTYGYSGNNVNLTYVPFSGAYTINAESGVYSYNGNNAQLIYYPIIISGSGTAKRKKGWGREREILEDSLRRIEAQDMRDIAETMAKSERPQAKRIIRKLADYSGEIKQLESLQRELAKLEAIQIERKVTDSIQAEKEKELTLAAAELKSILQEEVEIIEAYLQLEEYETRVLLSTIGITVH
jgi:hypothetical protein